jgi:hypothetical protein
MENALLTTIEFFTSSRMKSLYWRTFAMFSAGGLDILLKTLTEWDASATVTVFAGLIIGEITKQLNTPKK